MSHGVTDQVAAPAAASARRGRWTSADLRWRAGPVVVPWAVALVMLVVSVALYPNSIGYGGLATLTPLLGVLVIASVGQSLVIGTGGIDLSVSSVVTVVGVVFVLVSGRAGGSIGLAIVLCLVVGLVTGVVNGVLVEGLGLSPLVTTLATGQVLAGLANIWYGDGANRLAVPSSWRSFSGATFGGGLSYVLVVAVALALVLSVLLSRTVLGRRLTAASTSPRSARYLGIGVRRYRGATYVVASLLYTVGGLLLVGTIGTPTLSLGDVYQLSTIVAVVLGGAALSGGRLHPGATLAGALFLSLINQDVLASGIAPGTQSVIQGAVLVIAMLAAAGSLVRGLRRRRTSVPVASP